ncbi:MAG: hypothetical protein K0S39_354 [Paenibacillus sp.]|nr:hypothetical protein [Paenibacillus sp.]
MDGSDPGTSRDALNDVVILERDDDAVHGPVMKHDVISKRQQKNDVHVAASFHITEEGLERASSGYANGLLQIGLLNWNPPC